MSETKFTPGPWEAKSNNPEKEFTWLVYNRAHSQWPIAVEMKEADAHLISAAPDMLLLLTEITDAFGYAEWSDAKHAEEIFSEMIDQYWDRLTATIAKAKGKTR